MDSKYVVDDITFLCDRCLKNSHYEGSDSDNNEAELDENRPKTSSDAQSEQTSDSSDNNKKKYKKLFNFKAYHFSQI